MSNTNTKTFEEINTETVDYPTDVYFWQSVARHQFYRLSPESRKGLVRQARKWDLDENSNYDNFTQNSSAREWLRGITTGLSVTPMSRNIYGIRLEEYERIMDVEETARKGVFNLLRWLAIDY